MPPFPSGRGRRFLVCFFIGLTLFVTPSHFAQAPKKHGKKNTAGTASVSPGTTAEPNSQVPLPVGQAAKGLVLPDIDQNGRVRSRFVAGQAKRVDNDHMEFRDL